MLSKTPRQQREWIVVRTETRREKWAAQNVARQGYTHYLPLIIEKEGQAPQALFPGYLFVLPISGRWRSLTGTYGVIDVITAGSEPIRVPNLLIESLKEKEQEGVVVLPERDESAGFLLGEQVRLRSGPFLGYIGIYQGRTRRDRVSILLNVLGGSSAIEVAATQLEKL